MSGCCATVALADHVARRTGAECAAWSIGRPTAMAVAEAATHRGVAVAVTRHRTVAVVHRRIVVAVAIMVPIVVAAVVPVPVVVVAVAIGVPIVVATVVPVSVVVIVVVVSVIVMVVVMVAMALGRVGLVEVVVGIETAASMAVATLEGHEHCRTMVEHPSDTIACVDGEGPATSAPDDGTVEPLTGHEAVVLPGAEHKAQVAVTNLPPEAEHVGAGIYIEQVVEVDLIHCLIL